MIKISLATVYSIEFGLIYCAKILNFIHRVGKMEEKSEMPITFQMALAHNIPSMKAFLNMNNEKQNEVINQAKKIENLREMNNFVNNITKIN